MEKPQDKPPCKVTKPN